MLHTELGGCCLGERLETGLFFNTDADRIAHSTTAEALSVCASGCILVLSGRDLN